MENGLISGFSSPWWIFLLADYQGQNHFVMELHKNNAEA